MEIWAHRGASATCPENTMSAFEQAAKDGADAIEFDVQRTRDGELIVIHDETFNRTTHGRGYVYTASYSWVKKLDAGVKFHPRFRGERIPTLHELLDFVCKTQMKVNIEIKNEQIQYAGIESQVIKVLAQHKLIERAVISSFNQMSIQIVKKLSPNIETALLTSTFNPVAPIYLQKMGLDGVHPSKRTLNSQYMYEIIRYNLRIRPYTVNEGHLLRTFNALGVDAVITDHPLQARKVISS